MAFPRSPLQIVTEIYTGSWTSIRSSVYDRDAVEVTYGAPNEGGSAEPTQLSLTLNNRDGRYSPRNPLSPLWGLIGRYTPLRESIQVAQDSFSRTVVNGWGTTEPDSDSDPDDGHTWTLFWSGGATGDFDVAAGAGTMVVDSASEYRAAWLPTLQMRDAELAASVTITGVSNVTGGALQFGVILRAADSSNYYLARASVATDETVTVSLIKVVAGVETTVAGPQTVTGLTYSGQQLRIRGQVEGRVLRVKVWTAADGEPLDWHLEVADSTRLYAGGVGLRCSTAASQSNVPVTFSWDDFEARIPIAHVEVEAWPTRWDVSQVDVFTPLSAKGIRHRLGQGTPPQLSALYRSILAGDPVEFWSFEEGTDSSFAASALPGGTPLNVIGTVNWATTSDVPAGTKPLPTQLVGDSGELIAYVDHDFSNGFQIHVLFNTGEPFGGSDLLRWRGPTRFDGSDEWGLTLYAEGPFLELRRYDAAGTVTAIAGDDVAANTWLTAQVVCTQAGGVYTLELFVDGVSLGSGSVGGGGNSGMFTRASVAPATSTSYGPITMGYVAFFDHTSDLSGLVDAKDGYPGETAGARIVRLLGEKDIPITLIGDADDTCAMGPQPIDALLPILDECQLADMGALWEPRGAPGFVYRTRLDMYNQPSVMDLSYGVLTPFEPVDDDQQVRNDVRVSRPDGGTARAVLTDGRLSIQDPPDGIGTVETSPTVNVVDDAALPGQATWRLHMGTWDESRYPQFDFHLSSFGRRDDGLDLMYLALSLGVCDRFTVDELPVWLPPDIVDQVVAGGSITMSLTDLWMGVNTAPHGPYEVGVYGVDTSGREPDRYGVVGCELYAAIDDDDMALTVLPGDRRWSTDSADYSPDVMTLAAEGEEFTVNDCDNLATYVGAGTAAAANAASVTPGLPAGLLAGDVMFMWAVALSNGGVNAVSGWTPVGTNTLGWRLFVRVATSSEVAPTVTFTGVVSGDTTAAQIFAFRGVAAETAEILTSGTSASSTNISYGATGPGQDCSVVLLLARKLDDWTSASISGGFTEISEFSTTLGNDLALYIAYQIQSDETGIPAGTITGVGGTSTTAIYVFAKVRGLQLLTVADRGVNGVMKSHAAGETVELAKHARYALGEGASVPTGGEKILASDFPPGVNYRYQQTVTYTASGTFVKASYPGLQAIRIRCVGQGGGSGGVAATNAGEAATSGAGAGGNTAIKNIVLAAALATSETVTVGNATNNGAAGNNAGTAGADTSFGTHCVATGGQPGDGSANTNTTTGSAGGTNTSTAGCVGDVIIPGAPGIDGRRTAGVRTTDAKGGDSTMGFGSSESNVTAAAAGTAGQLYGGGASGAHAQGAGAAAQAGASGGAGIVVVDIYV